MFWRSLHWLLNVISGITKRESVESRPGNSSVQTVRSSTTNKGGKVKTKKGGLIRPTSSQFEAET
jgi:hypothetical protein